MPSLKIAPSERVTDPGGGPDDDSRYPSSARKYGFLAIAFGFAMGITFMIFFGLFRIWGAPGPYLTDFVSRVNPNLWICFIYGLIGGTLISAIYNFLIFRRSNLFGLD